MDTTLNYNDLLEQLLLQYAQPTQNSTVEQQIVIDKKHGHFQLLSLGWENNKRIYYTLLHVDLKNSKFWVQQDYTQPSITEQLLEAGVPKSDIVLGFQLPQARELTDFAVS